MSSSSTFLWNAWYPAAWAEEVGRTPLRRVFLEQPVVLYRTEAGAPVALLDRCPHRFVPLSRGKLCGDEIECIYHGLRFNQQGACTLNPHGDGQIPAAALVKAFPLLERHGMVWIWMGDKANANAATLPDFSMLDDRSKCAIVSGKTTIAAHYELINDNLLDLSHVQFLHAQLRSETEQVKTELIQKGNTVWSMRYNYDTPPNGLSKMFYKQARGDMRANIRWDPPSLMLMDLGITPCGQPVEAGISTPGVHLLCPETATSTHYFWASVRDQRIDDEEVTNAIKAIAQQVFGNEDGPTIQSQQDNMFGKTFEELKPVLLTTDGPATRARRVLAQLLEAEAITRPPA